MASIRLSKKGSLSWQDYVRGAGLAIGSAIITEVQQWLQAIIDKKPFDLSWQLIGMISISAFLAYLFKNGLLEKAKTIITSDSNLKAENATEKIKDAL